MKQINIVLCRPEGSINIGAICRAIKSMGLTNLKLVSPSVINIDEVKQFSLSSFDIYQKSITYSSLSHAVQNSNLVVGTCRRHGKHRKNHYLLPNELATLVAEYSDENNNIDIVFGNEQNGLSDEELAFCHYLVTIPTSNAYPSLNLSHAVQIICYELFKSQSIIPKRYNVISHQKVDELSSNAVLSLNKLSFFAIGGDTARSEAKMFWHDILGRASLTSREELYLKRFFDKISNINSLHYQQNDKKNNE
jgi:tRNA/rRNA methyltransferase